MANLLTSPGFEDAAGWAFVDHAARSTAVKRSGAWALELQSDAADSLGGSATQGVGTWPLDAPISVVWWRQLFRRLSVTHDIRLLVDPGTGAFVELARHFASESTGKWRRDHRIIRVQGTGEVRVRIESSTAPFGFGFPTLWYVDDTHLEVRHLSSNIRDTLLADLALIAPGNGSSLTVATVAADPRDRLSLATPAVVIGDARSITDSLTVGGTAGNVRELTLEYELELYLKEGEGDIDDFVSDVRNILERPSSGLNALQNVDVTATESFLVEGSEFQRNTNHRANITVEIVTRYRAGQS